MTSLSDVLGGRYRLVRLIGRGGMSDVYEAHDEQAATAVAVKIVRSGDPEFARRLAKEARVLESFSHPGLIRLLDTGVAGDQAYLVMDLVDGPTLAQSLQGGPLTSRETAALGARLASALAYVHERGVVHRDVKPSNILLSASGEALLGDFGIARLHDASSHTVTGTTLGTVSYMAPEQLEDHQVGAPADIWSLGIVLLECLTGERVYQGTPSEVVARRLAAPVALPADLPAPWRQVLAGMLDQRPEQRLSGAQVTALLSTTAFDAPWTRAHDDPTVLLAPYVASDATALIGAVAASTARASDETRVDAPARVSEPGPITRRWWSIAVACVIAVALLWMGIALALGSGTKGAVTTSTTTSSTTTTSTTTTTVPIGSAALATLLGDVSAGQSTGTLDRSTGKVIAQQAQLAVSDYGDGQSTLVSNDLQQAATAITNGAQSGLITPGQATVLATDLNALAVVLNVSFATTTTTTTSAPPAPGNGNGNGNGNGGTGH